jgi:hypothetical protein
LSVQGAPQFYHPMVRLCRRGDGSRLFVALAVDWFKCDGENGKVGDAPKLTKWSPAGMGSGAGGKPQVHRAIFHRPAAAPLIQLPPSADAVNWLGN